MQANAVENALDMSANATGTVDDAAVTYYNATWQTMACSGLDGDLVDDPTPQRIFIILFFLFLIYYIHFKNSSFY